MNAFYLEVVVPLLMVQVAEIQHSEVEPVVALQVRVVVLVERIVEFVEAALLLVVVGVVVEEWVDTEGMLVLGIAVVDMLVAVRILVVDMVEEDSTPVEGILVEGIAEDILVVVVVVVDTIHSLRSHKMVHE
jgi:hypothetical protein